MTTDSPSPTERQEENFLRVMDEIEIMSAVLADVEGDEVASQITMWLDYLVYRALYEAGVDVEPECAAEARECRKLMLQHLDRAGWEP